MEHSESQHIGDTIRIRRPPRVFTDPLGRNVWMGGVDPLESDLELEASVGTDPYNNVDASIDRLPA